MARIISGILIILMALANGSAFGEHRFEWHVDIALQEQYDDNVNLTPSNERDEYITTVSPGGRLLLDWKTGAVHLDYHLNATMYGHDFGDDRNYIGHNANLRLHQNLWRYLTLSLQDQLVRSDEPREVRITEGAGGPTEYYLGTRTERSIYTRNTFSPSVEWQYGKDDRMRLSYSNTMYLNRESTIQDSHSHIYTLAIDHWFGPRYGVSIDMSYSMYRFETSSDFDGQDVGLTFTRRFTDQTSGFIQGRASNRTLEEGNDYRTYSGSIGVDHAFTPTLSGRARAGYFLYNPEVGSSEEGFDGEISLVSRWVRLQGSLLFRGGYEESYIDAENLGFARFWSAGANIRYSVSRMLALVVDGTYRYDDFAGGRTQKTWNGRASLAITFLKWLNGSLEYLHQERNSEDDRSDYVDNRITFRLAASY